MIFQFRNGFLVVRKTLISDANWIFDCNFRFDLPASDNFNFLLSCSFRFCCPPFRWSLSLAYWHRRIVSVIANRNRPIDDDKQTTQNMLNYHITKFERFLTSGNCKFFNFLHFDIKIKRYLNVLRCNFSFAIHSLNKTRRFPVPSN